MKENRFYVCATILEAVFSRLKISDNTCAVTFKFCVDRLYIVLQYKILYKLILLISDSYMLLATCFVI